MPKLDHLEIGTISFERCEGKMVLPPNERVRLILAAVDAYRPDLLVTSGHAVHSLKHLDRLAELHREAGTDTAIITEVLKDGVDPSLESHAMWAVTGDGQRHRFGQQQFARRGEVDDIARDSIAKFESALPARSVALGNWNVFALICGEINIIEGRVDPRYVSAAAEEAIMAADVVINPTHGQRRHVGRQTQAAVAHLRRRAQPCLRVVLKLGGMRRQQRPHAERHRDTAHGVRRRREGCRRAASGRRLRVRLPALDA